MKKKQKSFAVPFEEIYLKYLKDPKEARVAIEVALENFESDNDVESLLNVIRLVAKAQGGLTKLAHKASVSRQALHEALSPKGNPRLRTFQNVLGSLGLRITVQPTKSKVLPMTKLF